MKNTIRIPDAIAQKVKLLTAERRTNLREIVSKGLEHVIEKKQLTAKDRSKNLFAAMDRTTGITADKRLGRAEAHRQ